MRADPVPLCEVVIAPAVAEDAGELLTLQRAAYVTEARIYGDPELPALIQTLPELQAELATATALKATAGHRIIGAVRARVDTAALFTGHLSEANLAMYAAAATASSDASN